MLLVVLALAVSGAVALAIAAASASTAIAWLCVAVSIVGLAVLAVDSLRGRERGAAESSARTSVLAYDARYPDYAAHDRPAHDAPTHDDHEVEREIAREEDFLHPDTGPLEPDISGLRAAESMEADHFRLGSPQDVANAVVYLASPAADYVSGQVLRVDGGATIT
jgi:hypothetical protein